MDRVITYLREKADIPVWLVGTRRGTESAAQAAIQSTRHPDGLVLTSSMTAKNGRGTAVTEMKLDRITLPVLIVAHKSDGCWATEPQYAETIKERLTGARTVTLKYFQGGRVPGTNPCQALSYHGFFGIEREVIDFIAAFIKAQS
jgi:hypothetical protein